MNIAVGYGRTSMLLAACGSLWVLGCGAEPQGAGHANADNVAQAPDDLYFATDAEAFEWIARTAEERQLGTVTVKRDEAGKALGVLIDRKATNADPAVGNDLMKALGAPQAILHIGDKAIRMIPEESATGAPSSNGVGTETSALSSQPPSSASRCAPNGFCTNNDSYSHNYWVYRSIGSSTSQTSGGVSISKFYYAPYQGAPYWTMDGWGNYVIAYGPSYCDTPEDAILNYYDNTVQYCMKTIITGSTYMGITNIYYSKLGVAQPNAFPILTESTTGTNVTSLDLGKWAVGIFVLGCNLDFGPAECDIDGVCGVHYSTGNGSSISVTTSTGAVDPSSCF